MAYKSRFTMFKKSSGVWMAMMASMMVVSCQNSSSSVEGDIQYLAVQTESDGKWGMIDSEGNFLFADEFKNEPSAVVNGYFSVQEGESYSLYSASAKPTIVPGCDDLASVGVFRDGIIPVTHEKSRITFIDGKGNVKATLEPVGGKEIIACTSYASEGLFMFITEESKLGFVDKDGKVVIEPKYDDGNPFSEGIAIVKTEKNDEPVFMAIDKKGQEVFRLKKDFSLSTHEFSDGLLVAKNSDDQYGFINKKGEFTKMKGKVRGIGDYNASLFAFMNDDYQWGVMDMDGEIIIRPKYGSVNLLPDGNFFVKDDDKYYFIDKKGDKIKTIEDYDYITALNNGKFHFIAQDKSTYVLLDKNGDPLGKEEFKGVNYALSVCGMAVRSDYFNIDSVLEALVGGVSANGIDKFTLNMPASKLGIKNEDAGQYVYSYSYTDPELSKEGWRYEVKVGVQTDRSIAVREYDYSYYDSKVFINPEAKVESVYVGVESQVPCWKDLKDKIISALQSKGFKVDQKSDDEVSFTGKDAKLVVSSNLSGDRIAVQLYSTSSSDEAAVVDDYYGDSTEVVEVVEEY